MNPLNHRTPRRKRHSCETVERSCPFCEGKLSYIHQYARWYCYRCERYAAERKNVVHYQEDQEGYQKLEDDNEPYNQKRGKLLWKDSEERKELFKKGFLRPALSLLVVLLIPVVASMVVALAYGELGIGFVVLLYAGMTFSLLWGLVCISVYFFDSFIGFKLYEKGFVVPVNDLFPVKNWIKGIEVFVPFSRIEKVNRFRTSPEGRVSIKLKDRGKRVNIGRDQMDDLVWFIEYLEQIGLPVEWEN